MKLSEAKHIVGKMLELALIPEGIIIYENKGYWISNEGTKMEPKYHVWKPGFTHSTVDSAYIDLSLAIKRCDYLVKQHEPALFDDDVDIDPYSV